MSFSRLFAAAALSMVVTSAAAAAELEIRLVRDANQRPVAVEAIGLAAESVAELRRIDNDSPQWADLLQVHVLNDKGQVQPPALAGRVELVASAVRFTPQFSLRAGMTYQARFSPPISGRATSAASITREFALPPPPPAKPTEVTAIYPSADVLPDNQLRFYLHFSAPMAAGDAYRYVKLVRDDGKVVNKAFLEITQELWDATNERFTLLFDPGRVKQGLQPRQEFGPVIEAGKAYRLVVDPAWRDANGQPLARGFEKRFLAGPAVDSAVDYRQWEIVPPSLASREALRVVFDRPLDHALIQRMITVADGNNQPVEGEIVVGKDERRWEFRPDQPWQGGPFALVVDTALEDSAGNNLARPFEVDVFERIDDKPGPEYVRIPLAIRPR